MDGLCFCLGSFFNLLERKREQLFWYVMLHIFVYDPLLDDSFCVGNSGAVLIKYIDIELS